RRWRPDAARVRARPRREGRHQARDLRRARRRAALGRVLPPDRPGLRLLLAVPRAARPARGRAGGPGGGGRQRGRRRRLSCVPLALRAPPNRHLCKASLTLTRRQASLSLTSDLYTEGVEQDDEPGEVGRAGHRARGGDGGRRRALGGRACRAGVAAVHVGCGGVGTPVTRRLRTGGPARGALLAARLFHRRMRNEVRNLRTARGLSQQELARAMDVSRQTINSIETGRYTPSLPLAIALARYFGTSVEEVFHPDGDA